MEELLYLHFYIDIHYSITKWKITQILSPKVPSYPNNFIILNFLLISSSVSIQCGPHLMWGIFPLQIIKSGFFPEFDNFFIVWCGCSVAVVWWLINIPGRKQKLIIAFNILIQNGPSCYFCDDKSYTLSIENDTHLLIVEVNQAVICNTLQRSLEGSKRFLREPYNVRQKMYVKIQTQAYFYMPHIPFFLILCILSSLPN